MAQSSTAYGRGKVIVFGEHAVVYGRPAVACSLPHGATATLVRSDSPTWSIAHPGGTIETDEAMLCAGRRLLAEFDLSPSELSVDVKLTIPVGAGLGSSAAMAVAVGRAAAHCQGLSEERSQTSLADAVAASEAVFHGNASGIDQQAALGGGFFSFSRRENSPRFVPLDVPKSRWVIAQVAPSTSTAEMVESVALLRKRQPEIIDSLLDEFALVADAGCRALQDGRWRDVGDLMNLNQGLLNALGVSTPELEDACVAARKAGGLGAKLTGSGGGGCIVVLTDDDRAQSVEEALEEKGDVYSFSLPPER